jgi:hypothetical protein
VPEPTNIEPESLSNLFVMRSVYEISTMEDERLNEAYWLSNPITDEVDVEHISVISWWSVLLVEDIIVP